MSFSLIKILEDLRTTHGKKAMYIHFSEEKTPVKRQRPSILTVQRMTRPREFCWKCQSLAYQLSHYNYFMCQCATTSVRWPTFVECFETAPLQYESWCTLCFWLMVWLKITRRSQKCFVCLFDGPAYRSKNMFGGDRSSPRHESGALCIPSDGVTLSTYSYWMKELYLH